jgi:hypothetical protein
MVCGNVILRGFAALYLQAKYESNSAEDAP